MIVTSEEFACLVEQEGDQSRTRLRSDTATESLWEEIIFKYPHLKRAVTLNANLPESIFRLLAKDPDPLVRADIAMKRALPGHLFALLAEDSDEMVRATIANNKKAPRNVLQKLAADVSKCVAEPARKQLANK